MMENDKSPSNGGNESNDVLTPQENLLTRVVVLDRKSYYLDIRQNQRGKYLKLTESSSKYRSTILLSKPAVKILQQVLNDSIKENYTSEIDENSLDSKWVTIFSRSLSISQKKLYFDLMQNERGRSINVAEIHPNRPKCSVLLADTGWFQFRRALNDITEVLSGDKEDTGEYYTVVDNTKSFNEDGSKGGASGLLSSKKMILPMKRFFFDLRENEQGRYCKLTQAHRTNRESIYLPSPLLPIFIKLLDQVIAEDYDSIVEGSNVSPLPDVDAENHSTLLRRIVPIDAERYYVVDLRENQHGRFFRICEEKQGKSSYIFIPCECFEGFRKILNEFISMG